MNDCIEKIETNIGTIEVVVTKRKNRPKGLRQPYEYISTLAKSKKVEKEFKELLKKYKQLQYAGYSIKPLVRGIRINLFVLAHKDEISKKEWEYLSKKLQSMIRSYLGIDAKIYAENYQEDRKFDIMFEAYVAFKELL